MNFVDINFRDILNLSIYSSIKEELKDRVKQTKDKVLPVSGIFLLALGAILILAIYILNLIWSA